MTTTPAQPRKHWQPTSSSSSRRQTQPVRLLSLSPSLPPFPFPFPFPFLVSLRQVRANCPSSLERVCCFLPPKERASELTPPSPFATHQLRPPSSRPTDPTWMLPSLLARKRRELEQTRLESDARLASLRQVELENERRREFGEGEQQGRKRKVQLIFSAISMLRRLSPLWRMSLAVGDAQH